MSYVCPCGQTRVDTLDLIDYQRRLFLDRAVARAVARPHPDKHLGAVGGE